MLFTLLGGLAFVGLFADSDLLTRYALWGAACFFAGTVTYRLYARLRNFAPGVALASVVELGILATIGWVMVDGEAPLTIELALLFCLAILIFAWEAGAVSRLLQARPFPALGRLWLSIYLTHAAVIFVVATGLTVAAKFGGYPLLVDRPGEMPGSLVRYLSTGSALNDNLLLLLVVVAVVVLSMLVHRYIELPGVRFGECLRRRSFRGRRSDDVSRINV